MAQKMPKKPSPRPNMISMWYNTWYNTWYVYITYDIHMIQYPLFQHVSRRVHGERGDVGMAPFAFRKYSSYRSVGSCRCQVLVGPAYSNHWVTPKIRMPKNHYFLPRLCQKDFTVVQLGWWVHLPQLEKPTHSPSSLDFGRRSSFILIILVV